MKPLVTLFDDALPTREFAALLAGVKKLGDERLRTSYQTTFWFDFTQRPSNLVESAVIRLRTKLPNSRCVGVEWWLSRMRTSHVKVDFHRDQDNALAAKTGQVRHPRWSTVLYLNRCRGGLLAVTRDDPNPDNRALAPDRHNFDLVEPAPNRFCVFDGRLTHGVLDAKNHVPGARLPRERSLRLAIAINFWAKRPLDVPTYPDSSVYRSIAKGV
jgi:hypothetical protein